MKSEFPSIQAIIWLAAIVVLPFFLMPAFPDLNPRVVADDSYYYYNVARNFVELGFFTFDGETLASGYHPLFMGACVVLYLFVGDLLPYAVPGVSAVAFLVYVWLVSKIAERLALTPLQASLFAVMLISNPAIVAGGWLVGLEITLILPLLAWFFLLCIEAQEEEKNVDALVWKAASVQMLLFFGRLDIVFVTAPAYLFSFRKAGTRVFLAATASALLPLMYIGVHYLYFGSITPSSANAMRALWRPLDELAMTPWMQTGLYLDFPQHIVRFAFNTLKSVRYAAGIPDGFWSVSGERLVAGTAIISLAGALLWQTVRRRAPVRMKDPMALLAGIMALTTVALIYIGTVRLGYLRSWYHGMYAPILALAFWMIGRPAVLNVRVPRAFLSGYVLVIVMLAGTISFVPSKSALYPMLRTRVATEATEMTGNERIGAFNAGFYGWASNGRIVNLDGLVNQQAFQAILRREMASYIWQEAGLRFILDIDPADQILRMINLNERSDLRLNLETVMMWEDGKYTHTLWKITANQ